MRSAVSLAAFGAAAAQGTASLKPNTPLRFNVEACTKAHGCKNSEKGLVMDANWRWLHDKTGLNCYTHNLFDDKKCPDRKTCAENCKYDGVDYRQDAGTWTTYSGDGADGVNLTFVTLNPQYDASNVGQRLYVLDGDKYQMFKMKNREIAFETDVSSTECGMNAAVYFVEMSADGGLKDSNGLNTAGAKFGTGYCDGQCAQDLKFAYGGRANLKDWVPAKEDPFNNTGSGPLGNCCAEIDLLEANKISMAFTMHPSTKEGLWLCDVNNHDEKDRHCGNQANDRYSAVVDRDGCDFNEYRNGNHDFYGAGAHFAVNSEKPFTIVTQFITDDGTDDGELVEVRQFYVQNGKAVGHGKQTNKGVLGSSITKEYCDSTKSVYDDRDDFGKKGGLKAVGEALDRGVVLAFSFWDDPFTHMRWLDSSYGSGPDAAAKGLLRGSCPTTSGKPEDIRKRFPKANVGYSNLKVGEIGSTSKVYPGPNPSCTKESKDPYSSGNYVDCCSGLQKKIGNWDEDGRWYYQCVSVAASCTVEGKDPYGAGAYVECCSGLHKKIGNWDKDGRWYYHCTGSSIVV